MTACDEQYVTMRHHGGQAENAPLFVSFTPPPMSYSLVVVHFLYLPAVASILLTHCDIPTDA